MALTINSNIASLNAQRNLNSSQTALATSLQRLSSGLRINSAKDDAAGLAISERFTAQIRGMDQAGRNANDAISLAQTAEGALATVTNNMQRIRELAVQSANATNSASDRAAMQLEVTQLTAEIDRVAVQTQFNGVNLLDGSFTSKVFQVGANANESITLGSIASARTSSLGQGYGVSVTGTTLTASTGLTASGQFAINGVDVFSASGGVAVGGSAKAIAAAINQSGISGVVATANATTTTGSYAATGSITAGTATLTINGIAIGLTTTAIGSTDVANTIAAIQANSAATGVTAAASGTGIALTAADGRNIAVSLALGTATNTALQDLGLGSVAATTWSNYSVAYTGTAGVTVTGSAAAGVKGMTTASVIASQATGTAVSAVDISTVNGATAAITSMDNALSTINTTRAGLGAVQNRFMSTIESLQTTGENLTASRSRIQDADFARETAQLSRNQILQQAGTAMLAQANASANGVMALLRG